jgi:hypothetical protein
MDQEQTKLYNDILLSRPTFGNFPRTLRNCWCLGGRPIPVGVSPCLLSLSRTSHHWRQQDSVPGHSDTRCKVTSRHLAVACRQVLCAQVKMLLTLSLHEVHTWQTSVRLCIFTQSNDKTASCTSGLEASICRRVACDQRHYSVIFLLPFGPLTALGGSSPLLAACLHLQHRSLPPSSSCITISRSESLCRPSI